MADKTTFKILVLYWLLGGSYILSVYGVESGEKRMPILHFVCVYQLHVFASNIWSYDLYLSSF